MDLDPALHDLLLDLKGRMRRRFGERFTGLYLFGSRARGDAEPDSDVDVAVVLRGELKPRPFAVKREILQDTYELLLDRGFYVQPWPLEEGSLEHPDEHPYAQVSRAVRRDGIHL